MGLCRLRPCHVPEAWGLPWGELPPMGASPDGLLRHQIGVQEVIEVKNVCPFNKPATKSHVKVRTGRLAIIQLIPHGPT